jgi:hypothetical protein
MRNSCGPSRSPTHGSLLLRAMLSLSLAIISDPAWALQPIPVGNSDTPIEINAFGKFYTDSGDSLTIEVLPDSDGFVGRMRVRSRTDGSKPAWFVFALRNVTNASIERRLAPQQHASGSEARMVAVTPSVGFIPERVERNGVDGFRLVISAGKTVTFVVELSPGHHVPMYLWPSPSDVQTPTQR